MRDRGQRRGVRVLETGCMGICPKHGVTALNATRPNTIHIIPAGTDAVDVARTLLGDVNPAVAPLGGPSGAPGGDGIESL